MVQQDDISYLSSLWLAPIWQAIWKLIAWWSETFQSNDDHHICGKEIVKTKWLSGVLPNTLSPHQEERHCSKYEIDSRLSIKPCPYHWHCFRKTMEKKGTAPNTKLIQGCLWNHIYVTSTAFEKPLKRVEFIRGVIVIWALWCIC